MNTDYQKMLDVIMKSTIASQIQVIIPNRSNNWRRLHGLPMRRYTAWDRYYWHTLSVPQAEKLNM